MRRGGTWRELFRQFCNVQIITLDMIREDKNFMIVSTKAREKRPGDEVESVVYALAAGIPSSTLKSRGN